MEIREGSPSPKASAREMASSRGQSQAELRLQWPQLLYHALKTADHPLLMADPTKTAAAIDLTTLQRMNVYHIQREIVKCISEIEREREADARVSDDVMERVDRLLKRYFDALRDLKFVRKASKDVEYREVIFQMTYLHSGQQGMGALMSDTGLISPGDHSPALLPIPKDWDFHGAYLEGGRLAREAFQKRLFMAVFAGAALIVPMIIMTLKGTKTICLVTTSAFVTVVAIILAKVMEEATPKDIVAATAAYAAVLVVFVGATQPTMK